MTEEAEDDLLDLCGVDPDNDPNDTWLETVKSRLRSDVECWPPAGFERIRKAELEPA